MPAKRTDPGRAKIEGSAADIAGARRSARRMQSAESTAVGRRQVILQIAARRFAEAGFEATTVRQIADEANILSGSLYHHFSTKEEMLHEIVLEPVREMGSEAIRIAALPIDAERRLIALISADLHRLANQHEVYSIAFNERKRFRESDLFSDIVQAKRDGYEAWHRVLKQGAQDGLFDPAIDFQMMISTIIRILNTGADWYRNEDHGGRGTATAYSLDQLLDFYLGIILRAVRAPHRINDPVER
jgi:AcrR family transcriptional regulator